MAEPTTKRYDVLTIGETMLRLSPPRWQRLEHADYLEIVPGGSESNLAVALSRMGLRVAWVSRMPNNPLGRRIVHAIRGQGVDVSHVLWTGAGRVGTYFVEFAPAPRSIHVIYDRQGSAMSEMGPADLNRDLLDDSRLLHLSGITPALSPSCRQLTQEVLTLAGERRILRSFDINYRSKLWGPAEARSTLGPMCLGLDVLFTTQQDAVRVFDCDRTPEETVRWLQTQFRAGVAVMTMGEGGAVALDREGRFVHAPAPQSVEIDPLGSGDAFAAGFLFMYLAREDDLEGAMKFAVAAAALKRTIPGDLALIDPDEIRQAQDRSGEDIQR